MFASCIFIKVLAGEEIWYDLSFFRLLCSVSNNELSFSAENEHWTLFQLLHLAQSTDLE